MHQDDTFREPVPDRWALPPVNTLLRLSLGDGAPGRQPQADEAPSRVEDVMPAPSGKVPGTRLLVAAPRFAGDVELPHRGAPCLLSWLTDRGIQELPARFLETQRLGQVMAWRVEVTGAAYRVQRRRFFRVPCTFPVTLRMLPPPGGPPVPTPPGGEPDPPGPVLEGRTLDLSEGGLRCTVRGMPVDPGCRLELQLTVDDRRLRTTGVVVRTIQRVANTEDLYEVALSFEDPDRYGDAVRRIVFAQQLRARQLGTD